MTRPDGFYADIATEREADREKMIEAFNALRPLSDYTKKQLAAKMWQAAIAYMQEVREVEHQPVEQKEIDVLKAVAEDVVMLKLGPMGYCSDPIRDVQEKAIFALQDNATKPDAK